MIEVERGDDGRFLHTFRLSAVNEPGLDPERFKTMMAGPDVPDVLNDTNCVDTAVRAGIEAAILVLVKHNIPPMDFDDIANIALSEFDYLVHKRNFRWENYGEARARWLIERAVERFYHDIYRHLEPILVEHKFGPLLLNEDHERVIRVEGTIDLYDRNLNAVAYKTTSGAGTFRRDDGHEALKPDERTIHPTLCCYALSSLGYYRDTDRWPFTYLTFEFGDAGVELRMPTVYRQPVDVGWVRQKLISHAKLIERHGGGHAPW